MTATFRAMAAAVGTLISGALVSIAPMLALVWILIALDFVTARRLGRRLVRRHIIDPGLSRLSSRRLGRLAATMLRTFALLLLSAMADSAVFTLAGFTTLPYIAAFTCVTQAISILENEAAANDAPWADRLRKYLVDKTHRHLP